ncbi:MAG: 30S ribosomal protein S6e [Methanomicrobiales archaeon]
MVDFKVVLSDPRTGQSYRIEASGGTAGALMGKRIGEIVDGDPFGLKGYAIQITGATDRTGVPARRDLPGSGRRRLLLSQGVGFKPAHEGERRRKSIRGNEISSDMVQINAKVAEYGGTSLARIFGGEEAEEPEPVAAEPEAVAEPDVTTEPEAVPESGTVADQESSEPEEAVEAEAAAEPEETEEEQK